MTRPFLFLLAGMVVLGAQASHARVPRPVDRDKPPEVALPVGKWNVEFLNGVKEVCDIGKGGESTVEEPLRQSNAKAEVKGSSIVITCNDDRIERWTPAGKRFLVEHFCPGSSFPEGTPVLGIAERAP